MFGEVFDPKADLFVNERMRPHWSQAGAIVFVTFRTKDSIPQEVLNRWEKEKNAWLDQRSKREGMDVRQGKMWHQVVRDLPHEVRAEFNKRFRRQHETFLDGCYVPFAKSRIFENRRRQFDVL